MRCDQPNARLHSMLASFAALGALALSSASDAELVTATVTCDNHYAIYTSGPTGLNLVGGNELGAGGSSGSYNWSTAESWSFDATGRVYVAAWSDNSVAQGFLAQFASPSLGTLLTGDARWSVYSTGVDRNDNAPYPTVSEMAAHVANANAVNGWESTFVGGQNGVSPWGVIAGITTSAHWIWWATPGDPDPMRPGSGVGEMLIFSFDIPTNVPAPGVALVAALAPFIGRGRRRSRDQPRAAIRSA